MKYNVRKIPNISNLSNELTTNETQKDTNLNNDIDDILCDNFLQKFTIEKFNEFIKNCKQIEINNSKHDLKLKKSQFIQIMKKLFPNNPELNPIFELIFNRFKILKCKIVSNNKNENYFLNNIYSNEEIDIFEISCALICFIKCLVIEKLNLLFNLIDIDEDGFINVYELKKMIYTLNYIFCKEQNLYGIDSNISLLSLASIKSKKSFQLIMGYPGNLSYIFQKEKYISFNDFISAVTRVYNYKYDLFPLFISLKKSLNINRTEKILELKKSNFIKFTKESNEILTNFKKGGIIESNESNFKNNLESEKKKDYIKINGGLKNSFKSSININNGLKKNNIFNINYNNICRLEICPGKINIKKNKDLDLLNSNLDRRNAKYYSRNSICKRTKSMIFNECRKKKNPITFDEMVGDINSLINQNKLAKAEEYMKNVWNETKIVNSHIGHIMKEKYPLTIREIKPYIFDETFLKIKFK